MGLYKSTLLLRKFPYLHVSWICISGNFVVGELPVVPTLPMPKAEQIGRPRYPYVWKIKCYFIKCLAPLWLPSALLFCGSNTSAFSNSRSRLTFAHLAKDAGSGKRVRIGAMLLVEFISSSAVRKSYFIQTVRFRSHCLDLDRNDQKTRRNFWR